MREDENEQGTPLRLIIGDQPPFMTYGIMPIELDTGKKVLTFFLQDGSGKSAALTLTDDGRIDLTGNATPTEAAQAFIGSVRRMWGKP